MQKQVLLVVLGLLALGVAAPALAAEETAAEETAAEFTAATVRDVAKFAAAAFAIAFAAFGGSFGQARAVASACTSMGRNPGAAGPVRLTMLLGLAFIESLVIYALVIAFIILGR